MRWSMGRPLVVARPLLEVPDGHCDARSLPPSDSQTTVWDSNMIGDLASAGLVNGLVIGMALGMTGDSAQVWLVGGLANRIASNMARDSASSRLTHGTVSNTAGDPISVRPIDGMVELSATASSMSTYRRGKRGPTIDLRKKEERRSSWPRVWFSR